MLTSWFLGAIAFWLNLRSLKVSFALGRSKRFAAMTFVVGLHFIDHLLQIFGLGIRIEFRIDFGFHDSPPS